MSYLIDKFKGIYRIKVPIDKDTNDFPRKPNGKYEDIDLYINCQYGNKVFHDSGSILLAYIPSLQRGHNIIKAIQQINPSIIFDIEETDSEILFKFKYPNSDQIIPLLKPKTNGANISPFSTRNLPKNKDYKIPDEELDKYKAIVQNIPKNRMISITHSTEMYIKSLITKRNPRENIKSDMRQKGLKPKEYIYSIGKWNDYIKYLKENL